MTKDLSDFFTTIFKSLGFTKKQTEVAVWVLHGFSNEQISVLMRTNTLMIKFHLTRVYLKANVKGRSQFIVFAYTFALEKYKPNILIKGL